MPRPVAIEPRAGARIGLPELVLQDRFALGGRKLARGIRGEQFLQVRERRLRGRRRGHLPHRRLHGDDRGRSNRLARLDVGRQCRQQRVAATGFGECRRSINTHRVAGLVAIGRHPDHAFRTRTEQIRERSDAVGIPFREIVVARELQLGVVIHEAACAILQRCGARAREALDREHASAECIVELLLDRLLYRGGVGTARASGQREQEDQREGASHQVNHGRNRNPWIASAFARSIRNAPMTGIRRNARCE